MAEGWISLNRSLFDNELWTSEPFSRGQAWVDLLLLANHKDSYFYKRGNKITIKRGELGRSCVELSDRWKWSRTKVNKFLKDLEKEQQIKVVKTSITQVVTIVNYDKFQAKGQQTGQQKSSESAAKVQQKDTYNNDNNVNNEKNEKNTLPKLKTKTVFSEEIINLYNVVFPLFPIQSSKATPEQIEKQSNDWKDELRKLIELDGFDASTIEHVVRVVRADDFWNGNFQTIKKLRTKNKEGVKYIDFFISKFKNGSNGSKQQIKQSIIEFGLNSPEL